MVESVQISSHTSSTPVNLRRKTGKTSRLIIEDSYLHDVPKTSRNRILKTLRKLRSPEKKYRCLRNLKEMRVKWAGKYMKLDMKHVHRWIARNFTWPKYLGKGFGLQKRQNSSYVPTAPWRRRLEDRLMSSRCKVECDGVKCAPSHWTKATTNFLASLGIKGDSLMDWPACSPDMNPLENIRSILKQQIYADRCKFSSKTELWKNLKDAAASVPPAQKIKLTQSTNDRYF